MPAGAEVMSLVNSDENKTFGVVLRTPVENSKGIPHILEHSVLCGSRKYPIKVLSQMSRFVVVYLSILLAGGTLPGHCWIAKYMSGPLSRAYAC